MAIAEMHIPNSRQVWGWLTANWLVGIWLAAAAIIHVVNVQTAPQEYRFTVGLTNYSEGERIEMFSSLERLHLSTVYLAWFEIIANVLGTIVTLIIGWLLIRRSPRSGFAAYLAFMLLALTCAVYPPDIPKILPDQPIDQAIIRLSTVVAIGGFFTLPFVFPNGRFVPRWVAPIAAYNYIGVASFAFAPDLFPESGKWVWVDTAGTILTVIAIFYSLGYRYRRVSTPEERLQTRWVLLGLLIGVPGFFIGDALMRNIGPGPAGVASLIVFVLIMPIVMTMPTIAIGISILQYRIFDIDVVLNRTLVWLILTAAITGTYIGVVIGIGSLIGSESNLVLSLLATGLVAIFFQPLRLRVQRMVSRLLYGERDDPYSVLTRLGHHIEDSLNTADLLPAIVRTTADMLRLPYAALFLERADGPVLVASAGVASSSTLRLPLTYQGQSVGTLEVATRAPGEVFGQADRRLLEDLARQIGVAARTVSLASDLQLSRERIVTSREEERRRLRRDLHDGLGAQLAALIMQAGTARGLLRSNPDAAERELADLREELRAAVADVRRLVLGLRPPALDELGLAGALRTRLSRLDQGGIDAESPSLEVRFDAEEPLPPLSAAAEVAAFRIVEEAVTNVVKHARASSVLVSMRVEGDSLLVSVTDDGIGIGPEADSTGLGLHSMRERATELGGTFQLTTGPDGRGAEVRVSLPAARNDEV